MQWANLPAAIPFLRYCVHLFVTELRYFIHNGFEFWVNGTKFREFVKDFSYERIFEFCNVHKHTMALPGMCQQGMGWLGERCQPAHEWIISHNCPFMGGGGGGSTGLRTDSCRGCPVNPRPSCTTSLSNRSLLKETLGFSEHLVCWWMLKNK